MSRTVALYLAGVPVVAVALLIGLSLDQLAVSSVAVVIALAVGLLALLPQILSANGNRHAEHKAYFALTLLPEVGGLTLVAAEGVVLLPPERIAWELHDWRVPRDPGFGETSFFTAMLRPHLQSGHADPVWNALAGWAARPESGPNSGRIKSRTLADSLTCTGPSRI